MSKCSEIDELKTKLETLNQELHKLKDEKININKEKIIQDQKLEKLQKYKISFERLTTEFEKTTLCN